MRMGGRRASSQRSIGPQGEARPAVAENGRRDHDMQPVEAAGLHEARDRVRPAFDQHPAEAARGEDGENRWLARYGRPRPAGLGPLAAGRESHAFADDASRGGPLSASSRALGGEPPLGSMTTRAGCGPCDEAHRQLRIVRERAADADDDGVDQRPQAMQMRKRRGAVDVMRMAGCGRNAPVERLADLAEDHETVRRRDSQWAEQSSEGTAESPGSGR